MKVRCLSCMKEYKDEFDICPYCGYERGSLAKDVYMLPPETVLADRYIVGEAIGAGGFAITYKAWDTKLETMIAIKEYFPENIVNRVGGRKEVLLCSGQKEAVTEYRNGLKRFLLEAKNTVKFNQHENIVHVYDFFEENQTAYYTMEYMEGMDLGQYIKEKGGKIAVDEAIEILLSVIHALKAIHSIGAIHRDISPDNIFLLKNGNVKLFDFGAARFSDKDEDSYVPVIKQGYAPPEQYDKKRPQGSWTDIYALGATMYRAITGVLPQESTKRLEKGDFVKRPREMNAEIPEYIDACLTRAMSIEPAFRFKNVEQFEEVLVSKRTVRSEKEEQFFRKKVRMLTVSMVSCILLIGAMIGFNMYQDKKAEAILEPASIIVWVPVEAEEDMESTVSIYKKMSEEFMAHYPEVSISFVGVPKQEYEERLSSVQQSELPSIYRSDLVETTSLRAAELNDIFELITIKDYYFWEEYDNVFESRTQVPLGIEVPVVYCRANALKDNLSFSKGNEKNEFYNGLSMLWVGSSSDYREVQNVIPGQYVVSEIEMELEGVLTDCWSVNAQTEKTQIMAAERLLYYWLGEKAQDIMHIQYAHSIPINKAMAKEYFVVNGELDFLETQLEKSIFSWKEEEEFAKYLSTIYEEMYEGEIEKVESILEEENDD